MTPGKMPKLAIELTGINKNFGNVCANKEVSLKVESGTIHGIIGENGAGKSTTFKSLTSHTDPTQGDVEILQFDIKKNFLKKSLSIVIIFFRNFFY